MPLSVRRRRRAGRRMVVCPHVGEEDMAERQTCEAAAQEQKELEEALAPLKIGLVHGKMNKAQKEETLGLFYAGALDVLVATTVIEVGVNVPNATVMVIEGAERFGLAQLHQLRGRVGRGAPGKLVLPDGAAERASEDAGFHQRWLCRGAEGS